MNNPEDSCRDSVQAIVDCVSDVMDGDWGDRDWEQIVVNYETLLHVPDEATSAIAFSVARRRDGRHECVDFRLSDAAEDGLERVKRDMHAQSGTYWTTCTVTIERDGRYRFDYGYGAPYRLSGNVDDRRFADYLKRYLAEKNGRQ
ncbi:hypothetical protein H8A95_02255 [Bradyrhizobium sp. Pear76]|uniref:hypothetical protein n=1 Tax=Bradyrhizobium oropedii TaxID=1571201 RepID=UPI001E5299C9|nr:hypothetical protein [Bradyrhizobium oropedii]MCC8961163.1 hypothetical protein [Bradyrhizobium oropedii]